MKTMKRFSSILLWSAVLVSRIAAHSCKTEDYYVTIDVEGMVSQLKGGRGNVIDALHTLRDFLATSHIVVPYTHNDKTDAWDAMQVLDSDPSNMSNVVLVYAQTSLPAAHYGTSTTWNREHVWPKSYGVGYTGADYSDLHHLRAADWNVNAARNNLYFDSCDACNSPAHAEAAPSTAKDKYSFRPPGNMRGDIARSMFYMAVRYFGGEEKNTEGLKLGDCPCQHTFTMGKLSTLLKWHLEDPPSGEEVNRTKNICELYQNNRNPFVDYPELAPAIFNSTQYMSDVLNVTNLGQNCKGDGTDMIEYCPEPIGRWGDHDDGLDATSCIEPGDVAIVAVSSDSPKSFSLVALKTLPAGFRFRITDNAWTGFQWRSTEGTLEYSSPGHHPGDIITWNEDSQNAYWEKIKGRFNLATTGDSLIIYSEKCENSTSTMDYDFSFALTYYQFWTEAGYVEDALQTALPSALVHAKNAVSLPHSDNYIFQQPREAESASELLQQICNWKNWLASNSSVFDVMTLFGDRIDIPLAEPTSTPTVPKAAPTLCAPVGNHLPTVATMRASTPVSALGNSIKLTFP